MRVSIETRALAESRFYNLMRTMKWSRSRTIGVLTLLWHDSQENLKVSATKNEIIKWLDIETGDDPEALFAALCQWNYLSPKKGGQYTIHGNAKHVAVLANRRRAGLLGGIESGKTRNNSNIEASASTCFAPSNPNLTKPNLTKKKEGKSASASAPGGSGIAPTENLDAKHPSGPLNPSIKFQIEEIQRKGFKNETQ